MKKVKVGIIGGSGLDDPKIIKGAREKKCKDPLRKTLIPTHNRQDRRG